MNILAIESSCDETSAAVIKDGTDIISNVVASSTAMHEKWGGIVPEVAAREQLKAIIPVLTEALQPFIQHTLSPPMPYDALINQHIDALAVTIGPGLIGSLLIGVETAKTIACATGKPIIPVHHVLAHQYANFLQSSSYSSSEVRYRTTSDEARSGINSSRTSSSNNTPIEFPAISPVVSGGHTELFLMKNTKELQWLGGTIDDAAGEAFDKTARLLGFGSRGGLAIQESAQNFSTSQLTPHNLHLIHLPRPMIHDDTLNFSFSGLKTAVLREVNTLQQSQQFNNQTIQQLSYEIQEAITDVLIVKTINAVNMHHAQSILISGGVAANLRLREKFETAINLQSPHISFFCPLPPLCTDNAAYIGSYAYFRGEPTTWHHITAVPDLSVEI